MFVHKVLLFCSLTQCLFLLAFSQYRYDCDENFCSKKVKCREVECEEGRLIKNATKCGCCHVCVEQLKEGEKCKTEELAVIPRQECGPGLKCIMNHRKEAKCSPIVTSCTREKRKAKEGDVVECDEFGFYKPVVCKSNVLCYCVNSKNGKRIFGTEIASNKYSMNCDCALGYEKFPRKIKEDNFLRCLPNGNYDSVQCSDDFCYCMGDEFNTVGTVAKSIKELSCYDSQRHHDDDDMLHSKCWRERKDVLEQIQNLTNYGVRVIGAYLPQCDLDGSYAPVQCKKDICYCVKKNGDRYHKRYEVRRSSVNAKRMTCSCARDHEMLKEYSEKDEKVKTYLEKNDCNDEGEYYEKIGITEIPF